jgi:S1-C subfamily serine protease
MLTLLRMAKDWFAKETQAFMLFIAVACVLAGCVTTTPETVPTMSSGFLCEMLGPKWIATGKEQRVIREELDKRGVVCDYGRIVGSRPSQTAEAPPPKKGEALSGSGFIVTADGHIVTNWHVVEGCSEIQARTSGGTTIAILVSHDVRNDLAILKTANGTFSHVARFRAGQGIRVGDDIIVLGFPFGELLGTSMKATAGTVSSLTGIANDSAILQITAPIQPGSSGGPLLDLSGNIVGVVTAKLDEIVVAKVAGTLPQNVNFAIKSSGIQSFLDATGIKYEVAPSMEKLSRVDVIENAGPYIVAIRCRR